MLKYNHELNYTIYFFNFYEVKYKLYYIILPKYSYSSIKWKNVFSDTVFINKQLTVQKITFNPLELLLHEVRIDLRIDNFQMLNSHFCPIRDHRIHDVSVGVKDRVV